MQTCREAIPAEAQALWASAWPLDPALATQLDEQGYAILDQLGSEPWLSEVRERIDELDRIEGANAAVEHHQEDGVLRLANLCNKGRVFDAAWLNPTILACCAHLFARPFKISSLNAREARLGGGHQPLHGDWKPLRGDPTEVHVANALWAIDDLELSNGAPRLVPGSNLYPGRPEDLIDDPEAAYPDQIIACIPAGSVVMINAHTWHGGTVNTSGNRRRVLHAYYTAREHPQQQHQRTWFTEESRQRFGTGEQWLLDVL